MNVPPIAWRELTVVEAKLLWRDPGGILVPVGLPLLILVMNGITADTTGRQEFGGLSAFEAVIVPMTLVMIISFIALLNLPSFLVEHRTNGWLRRLSATPAHPAMLLAAQTLVSLALTVVGVGLAIAVAAVAFDVSPPASWTGALAGFVLAVAALYAVGLLIAAVAPSNNAAIAFGLVGFFAMLALAGGFGGLDTMPTWLATLGEHTPMGAGFGALAEAWTGALPPGSQLAVLAGTAVSAAVAAARFFRWE